ncbi:hypothetical protein D5S17_33285 [Pseudonocardiaceae bacterium YIM PH 21723]|nr:hypothetical protein D5S17_33285 [Pseudonocardiaceae bacterium YIM PH 21723]
MELRTALASAFAGVTLGGTAAILVFSAAIPPHEHPQAAVQPASEPVPVKPVDSEWTEENWGRLPADPAPPQLVAIPFAAMPTATVEPDPTTTVEPPVITPTQRTNPGLVPAVLGGVGSFLRGPQH